MGVILDLFLSSYYHTQTIVPIIHHLRSLFQSRQRLALNTIKTYNKTRCREYKTNRLSSLKGIYYITQFLSMLNNKYRKWQGAGKESYTVFDKIKFNREATYINFNSQTCVHKDCASVILKKKIHSGKENRKHNPITSCGTIKNCYLGEEKTVFSKSFKLGKETILHWNTTHQKKKN